MTADTKQMLTFLKELDLSKEQWDIAVEQLTNGAEQEPTPLLPVETVVTNAPVDFSSLAAVTTSDPVFTITKVKADKPKEEPKQKSIPEEAISFIINRMDNYDRILTPHVVAAVQEKLPGNTKASVTTTVNLIFRAINRKSDFWALRKEGRHNMLVRVRPGKHYAKVIYKWFRAGEKSRK